MIGEKGPTDLTPDRQPCITSRFEREIHHVTKGALNGTDNPSLPMDPGDFGIVLSQQGVCGIRRQSRFDLVHRIEEVAD